MPSLWGRRVKLVENTGGVALDFDPTTSTLKVGGPITLADAASETFVLEELVWGMAVSSATQANPTYDEYVLFIADEGNHCTHMVASANTANSDSAGDFCVYVASNVLTFKNNRGANRYVTYWLFGA